MTPKIVAIRTTVQEAHLCAQYLRRKESRRVRVMERPVRAAGDHATVWVVVDYGARQSAQEA